MKLPVSLAGMFTISGVLALCGVIYIADCRLIAKKDVDSCWITGQGMIAAAGGIGASAGVGAGMFASGFRRGFWTLNPRLRAGEQPDDLDDEGGA
ncbi:MAG: hypothetical protein RLZZ468_803 [Cyanobacteriota bacterium]|jgi:hypothetical protein